MVAFHGRSITFENTKIRRQDVFFTRGSNDVDWGPPEHFYARFARNFGSSLVASDAEACVFERQLVSSRTEQKNESDSRHLKIVRGGVDA